MTTLKLLLGTSLSFVLAACGSSEGGDGGNAGMDGGMDPEGVEADADGGESGCNLSAAGIISPPPPDAMSGTVEVGADIETSFVAAGGDNEDGISLELILIGGFGALQDGLAPGTYTLAAEQLSPDDCSVCVAFYAGEGADAEYWVPSGGTVVVEKVTPEVDSEFSAILSNVKLVAADPIILSTEWDPALIIPGCVAELEETKIDILLQAE